MTLRRKHAESGAEGKGPQRQAARALEALLARPETKAVAEGAKLVLCYFLFQVLVYGCWLTRGQVFRMMCEYVSNHAYLY